MAARKLRKGTVDLKQFKDDVPDTKIKELLGDKLWNDMLERFKKSLDVGGKYPVKAYLIHNKIIRDAEPYLGNAAKYVLRALHRELMGGK